MFSDPSKRQLDYFDHVADGFSTVVDGFGTILACLIIVVIYVFGWPFALLSWFRE